MRSILLSWGPACVELTAVCSKPGSFSLTSHRQVHLEFSSQLLNNLSMILFGGSDSLQRIQRPIQLLFELSGLTVVHHADLLISDEKLVIALLYLFFLGQFDLESFFLS